MSRREVLEGAVPDWDSADLSRSAAVAISPDGTRVGRFGPFGTEVWNLPRPLPDPLPELERWRVWVECITRMSRDADGVVLPLPNDLWLGRKQRLAELGGPPVPQPVRSDKSVAGSAE